MPVYAITVKATATIEETWKIEADKPPTAEEAAEILMNMATNDGEILTFVSDRVVGDEERDYSTVEVEEV